MFFSTGISPVLPLASPPLLPLPPPPSPPLNNVHWNGANWRQAKISALVEEMRRESKKRGKEEEEGEMAAYTTHAQKLLKKGRNAFK